MFNISVRKFFFNLLVSVVFAGFSFQVFAESPWWTVVGSSGVVDEEDTPYVALGGSTPSGFGLLGLEGVARFKSNAPTSSTAAIRYNVSISPPDGCSTSYFLK